MTADKKPITLAPEWCKRMAEREGDVEIGAGAMTADTPASDFTPASAKIIDELQALVRATRTALAERDREVERQRVEILRWNESRDLWIAKAEAAESSLAERDGDVARWKREEARRYESYFIVEKRAEVAEARVLVLEDALRDTLRGLDAEFGAWRVDVNFPEARAALTPKKTPRD